jgi:hypothetical protein
MQSHQTKYDEEWCADLRERMITIDCHCQACRPPFQLREADRDSFSNLIVAGRAFDETDDLENKLNRSALEFFRAEELRLTSMESLAEDLSRLPINDSCRKIEMLSAVVQAAGSSAGFYGPIAVDRILPTDAPRVQRRRQ